MLRAVLDEHEIAPVFTRRELEERFLRLCRDDGLAAPEVNAVIVADSGPALECDFVWRSRRLVAETDGRLVHATRRAFEHDRRRDQRLMLAGWRVARFTWRQLDEEPATVAATLRSLLGLDAHPPGPAAPEDEGRPLMRPRAPDGSLCSSDAGPAGVTHTGA